jgi:uncharacterized protein YciI
MQYFALTYDVVPGFAEQRMAVREAHLQAHPRRARPRRADDGRRASAIRRTARCSCSAASRGGGEQFARTDPYVTEGLVTAWRVRPWNVVIGAELQSSKSALMVERVWSARARRDKLAVVREYYPRVIIPDSPPSPAIAGHRAAAAGECRARPAPRRR